MQKKQIEEQTLGNTFFPSYEVTFNKASTRLSEVFSPPELKEYIDLYERAHNDPKGTKELALEFQKKHPPLPEIYNLLTYIYIRLKKIKKAEKLTSENFEKNPDNLFAKINYADQCLRKNKADQIQKIFDGKVQLRDLYPKRQTFHYSELSGFMCLMGFYHLKIGDREAAKDYSEYAKLIDPDDPSLLLLSRKLHQRSFIQRMLFLLKPLRNK